MLQTHGRLLQVREAPTRALPNSDFTEPEQARLAPGWKWYRLKIAKADATALSRDCFTLASTALALGPRMPRPCAVVASRWLADSLFRSPKLAQLLTSGS